ncbi:MAG: serine hydrolase domain-containing protein [Thermomonas sp.]
MIRPVVVTVSALLVFLQLFAGAAAQQSAAPVIPVAVTARIDKHFAGYMAEQHIPGAVWVIVKDGRIAHVGHAGIADTEGGRPIDGDTLFRIASMSKAFTALAILKLRDEGRLSLDSPAETYVPEMKGWVYPTTDSPRIRVRDLLSHVAGFVTDDPWGDRQQDLSEADFTKLLKQGVAFNRAPQTAFEYSNLGYALLGRIITSVSGRPFDDYITAEIAKPLGMNATGYDIFAAPQEMRALGYRWENNAYVAEPTLGRGVFGAMGGVYTSANDYAKWVAFLLDAWPPRDGKETGPVRRSSVRELSQGLDFPRRSKRPGLEGRAACDMAMTYAMGFTTVDDCDLGTFLTHSGGYPGYGSNVLLLPDEGIGLFAFANRTYAGPSSTVRLAALELKEAGLLTGRKLAASDVLTRFYAIARDVYSEASLKPATGKLAMNFLLDHDAGFRERTLADLKRTSGVCKTDVPVTPSGALRGEFRWVCEHNDIEGRILMSPMAQPRLQEMEFEAVPHKAGIGN